MAGKQVFNRERGEWPFVVGDVTYKMRLTTNAMAEAEDLAGGRAWDSIVIGLVRGSVKDVRLLIWASLREFHRDIASDEPDALQAVGNLIDEAGGVTKIAEQIKSFMAANAAPDDLVSTPPAAVESNGNSGIGAIVTPTPSPSA